jgi:hypothetical protein
MWMEDTDRLSVSSIHITVHSELQSGFTGIVHMLATRTDSVFMAEAINNNKVREIKRHINGVLKLIMEPGRRTLLFPVRALQLQTTK